MKNKSTMSVRTYVIHCTSKHCVPLIYVCDWIWEMYIVHTSNFAHLEIHKNHREWYETFRNDKGLLVSHLSHIPNRFYELPKLKKLDV